MNAKAARTRLVHEAQAAVRRAQGTHALREGLEVAGDHAVVTHFTVAPSSASEISIVSLWTSIPTNSYGSP